MYTFFVDKFAMWIGSTFMPKTTRESISGAGHTFHIVIDKLTMDVVSSSVVLSFVPDSTCDTYVESGTNHLSHVESGTIRKAPIISFIYI